MRPTISAFAVILSLPLLFAFSVRAQEQNRDLSQYDKIGPFSFARFYLDQKSISQKAMLRAFIWNHWRARRRGTVTVSYHNMEGEPNIFSYYVEPEADGHWQVAMRIVRRRMNRRTKQWLPEETDSATAVFLDRIEIPKASYANPDPDRIGIPLRSKRSPRSYRLMLSDKDGKTIAQL